MNKIAMLVLSVSLLAAAAAPALTQGPAALPPALEKAQLQSLLQQFVDRAYLKEFRHLGDERDFDHGHFLYTADAKPLAVLYHTQELACDYGRGGQFGYIDPGGRNWIQWIGSGRIENADRYLRRSYPATPAWSWFQSAELPALKSHHTILDKMLDPERVPADLSRSKQIVFTRVACNGDSGDVQISLPTRERVCLSLTE